MLGGLRLIVVCSWYHCLLFIDAVFGGTRRARLDARVSLRPQRRAGLDTFVASRWPGVAALSLRLFGALKLRHPPVRWIAFSFKVMRGLESIT